MRLNSWRLSILSAIIFLAFFFAFAQELWAEYKSVNLATKDIAEEFSRISNLKGKKIVVVGFYNSLRTKDAFDGLFEDELQSDLIKKLPGQLIARNHMETILSELKLSMQDVFDDKNRKTLGKLLSADIIISGSYRFENEKVIVNVSAFDVETGLALWAQRVEIRWDARTKAIVPIDKKSGGKDENVKKDDMADLLYNNRGKDEYRFGWGLSLGAFPYMVELEFFYKWIHFSAGGFTGNDNRFDYQNDSLNDSDSDNDSESKNVSDKGYYSGIVVEPSLQVPFINIDNKIQAFGILGYHFEFSDKNVSYLGVSLGGKIRWIFARSLGRRGIDFLGLDFSFENVFLTNAFDHKGNSIERNADNFQIFRIRIVFLYQ